jgi:hypothetical protein
VWHQAVGKLEISASDLEIEKILELGRRVVAAARMLSLPTLTHSTLKTSKNQSRANKEAVRASLYLPVWVWVFGEEDEDEGRSGGTGRGTGAFY